MSYPIVDLTFWSPGDPGAPDIDALLADARTPIAKHGLTGVASMYAEETGAVLHDAHGWWADELAYKSIAVDGALTEVVPALDGAGVEFFVGKGPAIAYSDYETPRLRPYSDLDVYVPQADLERARSVLQRIGFAVVPQKRGQLGGVGRELYGGSFGAVVEVHDSVVDNLHRRYLPPVTAYLPYVDRRRLLGIDVPVLEPSAHVALQAVHLAAGHRYAKAILFRDISTLASRVRADVVLALGAARYLGTVSELLEIIRSHRAHRPVEGKLLQRRLAIALGGADPLDWDEHRLSTANVLALLNQQSARHVIGAAFGGARALFPARGRRATLKRPLPLQRTTKFA